MYIAQQIRTAEIPKINALPIDQQSVIEKRFGEGLQLSKVIALIKEASDNYTNDNPVAIEADELLKELLDSKNYIVGGAKKQRAKMPPKAAPAPMPKTAPKETTKTPIVIYTGKVKLYSKLLSLEESEELKALYTGKVKLYSKLLSLEKNEVA